MYPDAIPVINYANYPLAVMRGFFSISDVCTTSCMLLTFEHYVVKRIQSPEVRQVNN